MKQYHVGLIIGRFQPLHLGHMYLIQQGLIFAKKLIIGIGSANKSDRDNPFSLTERFLTLQKTLKKENLSSKIIKIVSIDDCPDDMQWLKDTREKTGPVDVIIGNNDWVNGIFSHAGYPVITIPFYKRHIYEGKKIRERMRKKGIL